MEEFTKFIKKLVKQIYIVLLIIFISCSNNEPQENEMNIDQKIMYYPDTTSLYEKLTDLDTSNGKFYFEKAEILDSLKEYKYAIVYYEKSLIHNYKKPRCLFMIGLNHFILGNDSTAIFYLKEAEKLDSTNKKIKKALFNIEHNPFNKP